MAAYSESQGNDKKHCKRIVSAGWRHAGGTSGGGWTCRKGGRDSWAGVAGGEGGSVRKKKATSLAVETPLSRKARSLGRPKLVLITWFISNI